MIRFIKEAIGIRTNEQKQEFIPTFKTTHPKEPISYSEWCIQYRVSMAYGKEIRHFG